MNQPHTAEVSRFLPCHCCSVQRCLREFLPWWPERREPPWKLTIKDEGRGSKCLRVHFSISRPRPSPSLCGREENGGKRVVEVVTGEISARARQRQLWSVMKLLHRNPSAKFSLSLSASSQNKMRSPIAAVVVDGVHHSVFLPSRNLSISPSLFLSQTECTSVYISRSFQVWRWESGTRGLHSQLPHWSLSSLNYTRY